MSVYVCQVKSCVHNNTVTVDREFIFKHYVRHLRNDLNDLAEDLGINEPCFENRFSLINTIIDTSVIHGRL